MNQPQAEAKQNFIEPERSPSEVMILVAVTLTTVLDAVFLQSASKFLLFVDRRLVEVGQLVYWRSKVRWEVNPARATVDSLWR